jgi:hypothetical protein
VVVDEAGTEPQAKQEPTVILSRSISRTIRPANLKLTISNGATAVLPSTKPTPALPTAVASPPQLQDRPLPPPPPEKSTQRSQMGNKASKFNDDTEEKATSLKSVFKRRPVPASTTKAPGAKKYPTLGDTLSRTGFRHKKQPSGPTSVDPRSPVDERSTISSSSPTTTILPTVVTTRQSSHIQSQSEATNFSTTPTNVTSIAHSSTVTGSTSVETTALPSPDLKATLLPSPSPVPEDSPSKYGLRDRSPPRSAEPPPVSKHYRGKSSTGFDIFKVREPLPLHPRSHTCNPSSLLSLVASIFSNARPLADEAASRLLPDVRMHERT